MDAKEIAELLGQRKIFEGLEDLTSDRTYDVQGWCNGGPLIRKLVEMTRPSIAIEVGTWKGKSALLTADAMSEFCGPDSKLICVDTWLGAGEFIDKPDDDSKRGLMRVAGWPQVYYQFLKNVVVRDRQSAIVPFPQTSLIAGRFLREKGVRSQLIYIDGSHDYDDVTEDLDLYWDVLDEGGIMFGDDYCKFWDGVVSAVDDFADAMGENVQAFSFPDPDGGPPSDYWVISEKEIVL